ncbi:hypothetical protein KC19_7G067100 [Ceratodon purpureus]|uniref:Uncharacterized protein n=1 Tax=Ceratodon purpureus TaxID=3225 RepID=A0A8T0H5F4_CERPU|nr:hypothetical protein KC19_7G067100 [Ceratodon purpureus]
MANKAVFTVVALLLAAFVVAEAGVESESFDFKIILHNKASRDVTFRLVSLGSHAYDVTVAKWGQWSAIGPLKVDRKDSVMRLIVSVRNKSYVLRKKPMELDLARRYGEGLQSKKFLVLTAVESWKQEFLFIKLGTEIVRRVKL